jgi:hypothetical protein
MMIFALDFLKILAWLFFYVNLELFYESTDNQHTTGNNNNDIKQCVVEQSI